MHHIHIDRYAGLESPIHSLDPRVKLIAVLTFVFLVVLTPDGWFASFGVYALLVWTAVVASRVPIGYVLKRAFAIFPFALAVSMFVPFITPGRTVWGFSLDGFEARMTAEGLARFASLSLKALLSFFATITLVASTPFGELMKAAGALGLPAKMVVVLSFMYRFLFLIIDETSHMLLARHLRGGGGKSLIRASGGIVGALLIRSMEHAETLSRAMILRGYTGQPISLRESRIDARDIALTTGFLGLAAAGLIMGRLINA
jgi:cobalt/nickel transport system permease protein